jgi:chaperonin GroES
MGARFIPRGDRVLVSVRDQESIVEGVLLPDSACDKDMQVGVVVAKGDKASYGEGDLIMFGRWAGKEIQLQGIPFRVMMEGEIDGKVVYDDPPKGIYPGKVVDVSRPQPQGN